ncbi:MAG: PadR family transcriptional regulator [Gemmatimonadales bacterium]
MPPATVVPILPGTLDVLILHAAKWGPRHGYAISEYIREESEDELRVDEGALYQALHRLERQRYLSSNWGTSENNRRAKFYELTPTGRRRLTAEAANWRRYALAMNRVLGVA